MEGLENEGWGGEDRTEQGRDFKGMENGEKKKGQRDDLLCMNRNYKMEESWHSHIDLKQ